MSQSEHRWIWIGEAIRAHVDMLGRVGLIDEQANETLADVIARVSEQPPGNESNLIAMIQTFDARIETQATGSVASAALAGRGVVDIAATVSRLELRSGLLEVADALEPVRQTLLDLASAHVVSVMPIMIDGAIAQPGTIAHWLGGLIAPLGRAHSELIWAFDEVNQSPMGAGSHASSGLENDRIASAEQLGFGAPIASAFDAVAATDHFVAASGAAAAVASPIGRWLNELCLLIRTEPASIRLGDRWRMMLSDMPQFDAPAGIEVLAAQCEQVVDRANAMRAAAMRTGYGPVSARLTSLLDSASQTVLTTSELLVDFCALLADGFEFNRAYLANRAGRAFSTSSDLMDFLMVEEQQTPQAARAIATLTISRARELGVEASGITPELIDGAALLVIGRELKVEFEVISRYLAPRRFIERRTAIGAPSQSSVRTYLLTEQTKLGADIVWRQSVGSRSLASRE